MSDKWDRPLPPMSKSSKEFVEGDKEWDRPSFGVEQVSSGGNVSEETLLNLSDIPEPVPVEAPPMPAAKVLASEQRKSDPDGPTEIASMSDRSSLAEASKASAEAAGVTSEKLLTTWASDKDGGKGGWVPANPTP